nr:response regulator [Nitrospirota bacterium]
MTTLLALKVLVVDDEKLTQMLVSQILKKLGVAYVKKVCNGKQALAELRTVQYDLVVTDVNMPEINGIELTKSIRADSALSHIPVLILTGDAELAVMQKAIQVGANDFIVKPFTAEVFEKKLAKIFPHLSWS